jgi:hypothetical protein
VNLPPKLYHGTSLKAAQTILQEGLMPRGNRENRWGKSDVRMTHQDILDTELPSRDDCVYLTEAYAPYYASSASAEAEPWAILEVDLKYLDPLRFLPDEDAIEQGTRGLLGAQLVDLELVDSEQDAKGMLGWEENLESLCHRTKYFRERLHTYPHLTNESLRLLGNVSYQGSVPVDAISRVSFFDSEKNPVVALSCLDAQISTLNYQLCGAKYRAITKWFFGDNYDWAEHAISPLPGARANKEMFEMLNPGRKCHEGYLQEIASPWIHPAPSLQIIGASWEHVLSS